MSERRRRHRIPVDHVIEARLLVDGLTTRGRVLDLNNAGAFVATDLVLEKNASLVVELRFPGEEKALPLKAIVARRTETIKGRRCDFPAGLARQLFLNQQAESGGCGQKTTLRRKGHFRSRCRVAGFQTCELRPRCTATSRGAAWRNKLS